MRSFFSQREQEKGKFHSSKHLRVLLDKGMRKECKYFFERRYALAKVIQSKFGM